MEFCELGRMAISRIDFWSFIALEDRLLVNLLIFDYLCVPSPPLPLGLPFGLPFKLRLEFPRGQDREQDSGKDTGQGTCDKG